jgi:hypothetical protein
MSTGVAEYICAVRMQLLPERYTVLNRREFAVAAGINKPI